jgi:hypothetical protein
LEIEWDQEAARNNREREEDYAEGVFEGNLSGEIPAICKEMHKDVWTLERDARRHRRT